MSMNKLKQVRCFYRANKWDRSIEAQYGFARLGGLSRRTYIGNATAIASMEQAIKHGCGYATTSYPEPDGVSWTLTVLRPGRK